MKLNIIYIIKCIYDVLNYATNIVEYVECTKLSKFNENLCILNRQNF